MRNYCDEFDNWVSLQKKMYDEKHQGKEVNYSWDGWLILYLIYKMEEKP